MEYWTQDPERDFSDAIEAHHVKVEGVAVHLLPWPAKHDEFDEGGVTQGHWIKISENGGTFVVQLKPGGKLTERHIFDLTKTWHGTWWIKGKQPERSLMMFIGSWCLEIPERFDRETRETGSQDAREMMLRSLNLRRCLEQHGSISSNGGTHFLVAHVIPYTELTVPVKPVPGAE